MPFLLKYDVGIFFKDNSTFLVQCPSACYSVSGNAWDIDIILRWNFEISKCQPKGVGVQEKKSTGFLYRGDKLYR